MPGGCGRLRPRRAECARSRFPRPGAKCPGKAGLEAGRGGGRSCRRAQPHCAPIPLLPSQALGHLQPPDKGYDGLSQAVTALFPGKGKAPQPRGHSPSSMGTVSPRPW